MGEAAVKVQDLAENPDPSESIANKEKMSLEHCKERITSFLNEDQQKTLALFTLSMAFADNQNSTEDHQFVKFLEQVLTSKLDLVAVCSQFEEKRDTLTLLLDDLETMEQQTSVIETLHTILNEKKDPKSLQQESSINYGSMQTVISSKDVIKDIISFYLQLNLREAKKSGTTLDPLETLNTLIPNIKDHYKPKEILKSRYLGRWSTVLTKAEQHIKGIKGRIAELNAPPQTASYSTYCLTQNKVVALLDKEIGFPKQLEEHEAYILLGVVGHASSSDGQQTDASEARYIQDLIGRLKFKVNVTKFSSSVALGLSELLKRVETLELKHAIYYESLSVIIANLEVDDDEKKLLDVIRETLNLSQEKITQMHTKYYLDSGLRGALDSLKNIPITDSKNGCLHRFQEVLVEADLVPVSAMAPIAIQCLERIDSVKLPPETPTEVRMAVFSLVGNAMRLDNKFDDDEKKYLMETMAEFKLSGNDLKNHPKIMKECGLKDLCKIVKTWARKNNQEVMLPSLAYYVLKAFAADGVIDPEEIIFKDLLFKELDLKAPAYARMLLRVVLEESVAR